MSTGGSRLAEMQARFQQRQLVEKEQKLLKIYETNQARVLGRLGTQTTVAPAGKVRQMFEERRTKAGIDKSYPLQPLAGASTRTALVNLNNRNISREKAISNNTTETKHSSNFNGNSVNIYKTHKIETSINKDFNLNEEILEDIAFSSSHDYEQNSVESSPNKIHNKSFTQKPIKPNHSNLKNGIVNKKSVENNANNNNLLPKEKPTLQRIIKNPSQSPKINSMKPAKLVETITTVKSRPSVSPQTSNFTTPTNSAKQKSTSAPQSQQSDKPKLPAGAMAAALSPNALKKAKEAGLIPCSMCQRCFAKDRIQKHEEICSKTLNKKRKQYDAVKHRVAGTEVETYVKGSKKNTRIQPTRNVPPPSKPSNWRKKHEEFIMAIRAAKQVQVHISKGGKLSDLPPPPPSDTSDYIRCPHCQRKFNQSAAERHIPKCANFQFNKPKPIGKKR